MASMSPPLKQRQQQQTDMEITKQSQYHYNKPHGPSTHPPAPESSLRPFSQTFYTEPASYRHLPLEIYSSTIKTATHAKYLVPLTRPAVQP